MGHPNQLRKKQTNVRLYPIYPDTERNIAITSLNLSMHIDTYTIESLIHNNSIYIYIDRKVESLMEIKQPGSFLQLMDPDVSFSKVISTDIPVFCWFPQQLGTCREFKILLFIFIGHLI